MAARHQALKQLSHPLGRAAGDEKLDLGTPESSALKNGFAYKPGLAALIKLAESAKLKLAAVGKDTQPLEFALNAARAKHSFAPGDRVFGEPETK